MAYAYVNGFVRAKRTSATWVATDLRQIPLNQLLTDYHDVYLQLSNTFDPNPEYVTRALLVQNMPNRIPSPTVSAWLAGLGQTSIITTPTPPFTKNLPVRYSDAWQAGYVVQRSDSQRSPQSQVIPSGKPDLLLTKNGLDLYAMSKYLLVSVNGFLHQSSGSINGLYAIGGGISGLIANENHVGVFSFRNVGTTQQIPINAGMLMKPNPDLQYRQSVYVKLPISLTGKTVLLSLGGYLHVLDESYTVVGDRTVKLNMRYIPLPQRIYQSIRSIDLSSLPLEKGPGNAEQFTVDSIYSDATIQAYLELSQTFFIVINTPNFYRRTYQLERPLYPGRYFNQQGQRLPLMGPHGRMYDYRLSKEMDTYVYGSESVFKDNYMFETTDYLNKLSIADGRQGYRRVSPGDAFLLECGTFGP